MTKNSGCVRAFYVAQPKHENPKFVYSGAQQDGWNWVGQSSTHAKAMKPDFQTVLREGQIHPSGRKLPGQCWHTEKGNG